MTEYVHVRIISITKEYLIYTQIFWETEMFCCCLAITSTIANLFLPPEDLWVTPTPPRMTLTWPHSLPGALGPSAQSGLSDDFLLPSCDILLPPCPNPSPSAWTSNTVRSSRSNYSVISLTKSSSTSVPLCLVLPTGMWSRRADI